MSTAYYALFHKVIERSADQIVGVTAGVPLRSLISRAFGHGTMRELAEKLGRNQAPKALQTLIPAVPADLGTVANAFVELQAERHRADYDLSRPFRKAEVVRLLRLAEHAIGVLDGQLSTELKHFLIVLPMWPQLKSR